MKSKLYFLVFFFLIFSFLLSQTNVSKKDILSKPGWIQVYDDFNVDMNKISSLKKLIKDDIRIDVYFAFWCGDSRKNVPAFIKILDKLNYKKLSVNFYSIERKKDKSGNYFIDSLKIERVPTFVFYKDNDEIGRIIENPEKTLLDDFMKILKWAEGIFING